MLRFLSFPLRKSRARGGVFVGRLCLGLLPVEGLHGLLKTWGVAESFIVCSNVIRTDRLSFCKYGGFPLRKSRACGGGLMGVKMLSGVCVNCSFGQEVNRREWLRGIVPSCQNCGSRLEVSPDVCECCGGSGLVGEGQCPKETQQ